MLKPVNMTKVRIVGLKNSKKAVIDLLYDMKLLHLVDFVKNNEGFFDLGKPFSEAKEVSELLVKANSINSFYKIKGTAGKISDFDSSKNRLEKIFSEFSKVSAELAEQKQKMSEIKSRLSEPMAKIKINSKYMAGFESLATFNGITKKPVGEKLREAKILFEIVEEKSGDNFAVVLFVRKKDAENAKTILFNAGFSEAAVPKNFSEKELLEGLSFTERKIIQAENALQKIGTQEKQFLIDFSRVLKQSIDKAHTPLRFGESNNSFMATGWVPANAVMELKKRLGQKLGEKIFVEFSESKENAPIKLRNPPLVKPFEFFLDLYTMPSYKEIDPSALVAITFPLFFGFMLGDIGYGIVTLAIFFFLSLKAKGKLKAFSSVLIWSSISTIIFGIIFGEFFGAEIIEHPLLNRVHEPTQVLGVAILIGFIHINFGLLVGFYNELKSHGFKHAFFAKLSWLVLEAGIVLLALGMLEILPIGVFPGAIAALAAVVMLYLGEGARGIVELPSIFSNILSYARLFAVGLSSVSIALVVNQMAGALWETGIVGMVIATIILVIGHVLNLGLGLLGPSLHSLRLHYVEFFTKFFHGGGHKYRPFGQIEEN